MMMMFVMIAIVITIISMMTMTMMDVIRMIWVSIITPTLMMKTIARVMIIVEIMVVVNIGLNEVGLVLSIVASALHEGDACDDAGLSRYSRSAPACRVQGHLLIIVIVIITKRPSHRRYTYHHSCHEGV